MRGFFTQSETVLCSKAPSVEAIEAALDGEFPLSGRMEAPGGDVHWAFHAPVPHVVVPLKSGATVIIDVVDERWPDTMGQPLAQGDVHEAWKHGFFGPFVTPGGLMRATQQSWGWREGGAVALKHKAFVRLRVSHVLEDDEVFNPDDLDSVEELSMLTRLSNALLEELDEAVCYYNPNGESIRNAEFIADCVEWWLKEKELPIEAWTNVRISRMDPEGTWMMLDSVGMRQLQQPDIQVCCETGKYELQDIAEMIRNLNLYLLKHPDSLKTGHTVAGVGRKDWKVTLLNTPLTNPPRPVVQLLPVDGTTPPPMVAEVDRLLNAGKNFMEGTSPVEASPEINVTYDIIHDDVPPKSED